MPSTRAICLASVQSPSMDNIQSRAAKMSRQDLCRVHRPGHTATIALVKSPLSPHWPGVDTLGQVPHKKRQK